MEVNTFISFALLIYLSTDFYPNNNKNKHVIPKPKFGSTENNENYCPMHPTNVVF